MPPRFGVTHTENNSAPDAPDFDMHTMLVPAQVAFKEQTRWNNLSSEDVRDLQNSPLNSLSECFERFEPSAAFSVSDEARAEALERLKAAGVSAAQRPGALGGWAVRGRITETSHFSPRGVAEGGDNWTENIFHALGELEKLTAAATSVGGGIDFERPRDDLAEDIDALLALLGASASPPSPGGS